MKLGIIIETNDPEKTWNATRFANASLKRGHSVKIFLMGAGRRNSKYQFRPV